MTLGDLSLELEKAVPFVLQFGVMPSRTQLLEAGRPDLLQAIKVGNGITDQFYQLYLRSPHMQVLLDRSRLVSIGNCYMTRLFVIFFATSAGKRILV